jgi:hypothetical protein
MTDQTLLKPKNSKGLATPWRNRIVGQGDADPAQLVANPLNWRTHPSAQRWALTGSLDSVGWVQQMLVNRATGRVVDGHARIDEAISRHEALVPVLYIELSDEEERLVLSSLDPIAAMATADKVKLEALLRDLTSTDVGLQALLDSLADKNGIRGLGLSEPDELPPEPDQTETYVRASDLFQLGPHRVLCGDSTNPADVARLMAGAEAECLWTDPPYGIDLPAGRKADWIDGPASLRSRQSSVLLGVDVIRATTARRSWARPSLRRWPGSPPGAVRGRPHRAGGWQRRRPSVRRRSANG